MKLEQPGKIGSECELNARRDSPVGKSVRTELSGCGLKSHSSQLCIVTSKNPRVVNTICINYFSANVITCARFCLKQMSRLTKAMLEIKCEHWANG